MEAASAACAGGDAAGSAIGGGRETGAAAAALAAAAAAAALALAAAIAKFGRYAFALGIGGSLAQASLYTGERRLEEIWRRRFFLRRHEKSSTSSMPVVRASLVLSLALRLSRLSLARCRFSAQGRMHLECVEKKRDEGSGRDRRRKRLRTFDGGLPCSVEGEEQRGGGEGGGGPGDAAAHGREVRFFGAHPDGGDGGVPQRVGGDGGVPF